MDKETPSSPSLVSAKEVHQFWENRAKSMAMDDKVNLSNLEPDVELAQEKQQQERAVLNTYLNPEASETMLDLGAGHGAWAVYYSKAVKKIDCVEFSNSMAAIAREYVASEKVDNVDIFCQAAQTYVSQEKYDVILISGLLIYLDEENFQQLLGNLVVLLKDGGRIILRDGTARSIPYTITSQFSEGLQANYSAHYRTVDEYIEAFAKHKFKIIRHQDMFPSGSPLNKWDETILRIYEFRRSQS